MEDEVIEQIDKICNDLISLHKKLQLVKGQMMYNKEQQTPSNKKSFNINDLSMNVSEIGTAKSQANLSFNGDETDSMLLECGKKMAAKLLLEKVEHM